MRSAPGKSFGAIIFFVLCIVLATKTSPAGEKENREANEVLLMTNPFLKRYYAFKKSCPYSEGEILEKVGKVEKDLESVQEDLRKYKKRGKNESI